MSRSDLHVLHVPLTVPYKNAVEAMAENQAISKLNLTIRVAQDLHQVFAKMATLHLSELHLHIDEQRDCDDELMFLYQTTKHLVLGAHPLQVCSITYRAANADGRNNPVRLMTLLNLLNQLNWDRCRTVEINLDVNYIDDDPRLAVMADLPVRLAIRGKSASADCAAEKQVRLLAQSYAYLEGVL